MIHVAFSPKLDHNLVKQEAMKMQEKFEEMENKHIENLAQQTKEQVNYVYFTIYLLQLTFMANNYFIQ